MTTPNPIDWLRELERAATKGLWIRIEGDLQSQQSDAITASAWSGIHGDEEGKGRLENARLIAAARNLLPILIDALEAQVFDDGCQYHGEKPLLPPAGYCIVCSALAAIAAEQERQS